MTILDERSEIIFFCDVFRDDPIRDPNISIVAFVVEGGDEIKVRKSNANSQISVFGNYDV